jgi:DNA-binding phage protein
LLHNTPLVPLIVYFKRFWDDYISIEKQREAVYSGNEDQTNHPELYAYIVDMWSKKSKSVPDNFNDTMSRYNEIMLADKTEFEEHIMAGVNEDVAMFKELLKLAKDKGASKEELEKILMKPIKTQFRAGVKRARIDRIRGRFPLKIIRIQRRDDPDDVANQMMDFSPKTIETLFKEGYEDSKKSLENVFHDEREKLRLD